MKYFTGNFGHKMVGMLLILALVSVAAVPAAALPAEAQIGHSAASSDGEDGRVSCEISPQWGYRVINLPAGICETYLQGLKDGRNDGVCLWRGYSLEKRLEQHHCNEGQRLAYTGGYIFGYTLGKWALLPPW